MNARYRLGALGALACATGVLVLAPRKDTPTAPDAVGGGARPPHAGSPSSLVPSGATDAGRDGPSRRAVAIDESLHDQAPKATPVPAATIQGIVETYDGERLPSVRVELWMGGSGPLREAVSDPAGRFEFAQLGAEEYRLVIDGETLPDGWVPPHRQGVCRHEGQDGFLYATCVDFRDELGVAEVTLLAFPGSAVHGRLLGPEGEPVQGTQVRIHSRHGVSRDTKTGTDGGFSFESVLPGDYSATVHPGVESRYDGLPSPEMRFHVATFDTVVLPDMVMEPGDRVIRGRLVDQDGRSIRNVLVLCYRAAGGWGDRLGRARMDDDGRFLIEGVPRAEAKVQVGFRGFTGYDDLVLQRPFQPIVLDLRTPREIIRLLAHGSGSWNLSGLLAHDPLNSSLARGSPTPQAGRLRKLKATRAGAIEAGARVSRGVFGGERTIRRRSAL